MHDSLAFGWEIVEIVWINILLSGDNAILIALACRNLPDRQRRIGIVLGALGAILLRIAFTLVVGRLLDVVLLKLTGGLFVIWLAIKLPQQGSEPPEVDARGTLWSAVRAIVAADAIMSLDNVLALAAAANGSMRLIIFGLLLSAPLVMFGAQFLAALMDRFPALIWAGAGVLGWAGGELIAGDPLWSRLGASANPPEFLLGAAGGAVALLAAAARRPAAPGRKADSPAKQ
jgi:YjbE family integral membrane protein